MLYLGKHFKPPSSSSTGRSKAVVLVLSFLVEALTIEVLDMT